MNTKNMRNDLASKLYAYVADKITMVVLEELLRVISERCPDWQEIRDQVIMDDEGLGINGKNNNWTVKL